MRRKFLTLSPGFPQTAHHIELRQVSVTYPWKQNFTSGELCGRFSLGFGQKAFKVHSVSQHLFRSTATKRTACKLLMPLMAAPPALSTEQYGAIVIVGSAAGAPGFKDAVEAREGEGLSTMKRHILVHTQGCCGETSKWRGAEEETKEEKGASSTCHVECWNEQAYRVA